MRRSILILCIALCVASPAVAQIPGDYPVVGLAESGDCDDPPSVWSLTGLSPFTGIHDFWICPILYPDHEPMDAVRFGVTWPEDWTWIEMEVCNGSILEGEISSPGTGTTMGWTQDPHEPQIAVRLRIDAATSGRFELIPHPGEGDIAYRTMDGQWYPMMFGTPDHSPFRVQIGDYDLCEDPHPIMNPSDFCDLQWYHHPGGVSLPASLNVAAGAVLTDTLHAYSIDCSRTVLGSCGQPYPGTPCFDGAWSDSEWLRFRSLGPEVGEFQIEMTVDARNLEPGAYTALVSGGGGWCGRCGVVCYDLEIDVEPTSIEGTTWGEVKGLYR